MKNVWYKESDFPKWLLVPSKVLNVTIYFLWNYENSFGQVPGDTNWCLCT